MHAVDRGPEPLDLKPIRKKYTPKWVAYYRKGKGKKPTDSKWRAFHGKLRDAFAGFCGYCEAGCKGEVEHFRPKSGFPEKVYRWSNWVLACHVCNHKKGQEWPTGGYVDPCARTKLAQPESFFAFDTKTGELSPQQGLTPARRRKAENTIKDLGLNAYHHRQKRVRHLRLVSTMLRVLGDDTDGIANLLEIVASRAYRLSSITRAWLREHGHWPTGG